MAVEKIGRAVLRGLVIADPEAEVVSALIGGDDAPVYLPVDSSFIRAIQFDPPDTITVHFSDTGKSYSYSGSRDLFDEFAAAESKGAFFNANIR